VSFRLRKTDVDPGIPSFTLVATDVLVIDALYEYKAACDRAGLLGQIPEIDNVIEEFLRWRNAHPDQVHLPNYQHRNLDPPPGYFALLKKFVDWFHENDGGADDFGRFTFVARAEMMLEDWNDARG
jgi:hypothetical protein